MLKYAAQSAVNIGGEIDHAYTRWLNGDRSEDVYDSIADMRDGLDELAHELTRIRTIIGETNEHEDMGWF